MLTLLLKELIETPHKYYSGNIRAQFINTMNIEPKTWADKSQRFKMLSAIMEYQKGEMSTFGIVLLDYVMGVAYDEVHGIK